MAYILGNGSDALTGTIGDDQIDHRGGNVAIDGGGGFDTSLFFDDIKNYTFTTLLGVTKLAAGGRAATEYAFTVVYLVNVEKVQFLNGQVSLEPTPPGVLVGTSADEQITGTLGNDIIDPRGGADVIDGKAGNDTALFFDSSSHYTIQSVNGVLRVNAGGRAAAPYVWQEVSLYNVESLQFLDSRISFGGSGDDVLTTWQGRDTIYGGDGIDTVVIGAARSACSISRSDASINIGGASGGDTLQNVERLHFTDLKLAFDLREGQLACNTALMAAAAVGPAFLDDPTLFGAGLRFADQFGNMQQLAEGVMNLGIFDQLDDRAFVEQLFRNVQHVPSAGEAALYEWALDFGIDRSQVLRVIAESDYNINSIDLIGLQKSGIEFI